MGILHRTDSDPDKAAIRHQSGYSLFEALIALAITGVVAGIAVPSLQHLMASNQITIFVNQLITDLHLSRSEAIKRGQRVTLCKSSNGKKCTADSSWNQGWLVFVDPNHNYQIDSDESILRIQQAMPAVAIRFNGSGGGSADNYVSYYPDGYSWKNGTFTLCSQSRTELTRAIILYRTGRPRVARKSADKKKALSCNVSAI